MTIVFRKIVFALEIAVLLVACVVAKAPIFKYRGELGADRWGSLSPNWQKCSSGTQQSPINILKDGSVYDSTLQPLKRDYSNANATLISNGYNIQLRYEEGVGNAVIEGKNYSLQELHWHVPSEHTLDGQRVAVELQIVHKSQDGNLAVVAILYQQGRSDTFVAQFKDELQKLKKEVCGEDEEKQLPVGVVMNKALSRSTRKYYRYVGSLTAPPCTENVIWTVMARVREMSEEQINELIMPLAPDYRRNSRSVQPLNGRKVRLYDELHNVVSQTNNQSQNQNQNQNNKNDAKQTKPHKQQ